ncbi:MAG: hypothetical protein HKO75_02055 [Flavobacteriaceae bacterium]|nr:hypothetical protein [Muriicola sp.]NNC62172.1 hypothetical protein [Eudoraea sp.]NNL38621.1 hypothetical protein [Flavobacteriaceae bacterium]
MKIRIKGNSVRFRLTKSEVEELCLAGYIKETTHFPENTFSYAVKKSSRKEIHASFEEGIITLHVDADKLNGWDANEEVGFEVLQQIDPETSLHLLLEKDFVCLDQRLEDQSDNYPNPKMDTEN